MSLKCVDCGCDHDYDLAPDEGVCILCGSMLIDEDGALPDVEAQIRELMDLVGEKLDGMEHVTKGIKPGAN